MKYEIQGYENRTAESVLPNIDRRAAPLHSGLIAETSSQTDKYFFIPTAVNVSGVSGTLSLILSLPAN